MLGENILVAPVFINTSTREEKRDVYLPGPAKWKQLWHGTIYDVSKEGMLLKDVWCPIGQPPVYYRDTEQYTISKVLSQF